MDWEDGGTNYGNPWYFRGFFYVSDANRTAFRMFPLVVQSGDTICDIMTVWVAELHSGALMAMPTFTHVNITDSSSFDWQGGPWTIYNNRQIGTTINDTGSSCSFTGSHVHESHVGYLPSLVTTTLDTSKYTKDGSGHNADGSPCNDTTRCCPIPNNPNMTCGTFRNNYVYNWTRKFAWAEGAAPH